ncbi:ATP-binding protein [Chenggangzhangella methanolivorans]|uniref:TniB family NTP-binding protein n=1 Tax=Chenggangzhangella methanolivorans TaxID=1437009 RepID=A0A9E6URD9_9HYPH|nr:ATP-binding protein [Chenggangzhangella methanolivorans]QZO02165.1 TniB family NTP-binding protein [Chenggangzhangella methanolivorans]
MLDNVLKGADFDHLADLHAQRIQAVKAIRINTDRTSDLVSKIRLFMRSATGGAESSCASLTAPTRGGKTTIINTFRAAFEPEPSSTSDQMPIVYVEVPSSATPKTLGRATLERLKDINPDRGDGDYKRLQITKGLRKRGTRLLIFDEMQRLVERDRGKVSYKVADWIQGLINDSQGECSFLLVGTTRSRRIYEANGHLVGRNDFHFEIQPYKRESEDPEDWKRYRAYLAHFDQQLRDHAGFAVSDLHKSDLARRIHAASLGYPGATAKLIQTAAVDSLLNRGGERLDLEAFATGFDRLWRYSEAAKMNPFSASRSPLPEQVWPEPWADSLD